ncbi:MAG: FAD-dependent oxidoreductase, partial [Promethearchaeota archaeon]
NVDLMKFVEGVWSRRGFSVLYPNNKEQMIAHVKQGKVIIVRGFGDCIDKAYEENEDLVEAYDNLGAVPQIYYWLKTVKTKKVEIDGAAKYIGTFAIEGPQFHWNQTDPFAVSKAELAKVKGAHIQAEMHKHVPGFENCILDRIAMNIGFRQTRIPIGLYALTKSDVLGHARFDDVIGRGSGHDVGRGNPKAEYGYDIPYRCLVPAEIDGLLFGARCISVESDDNDKQLIALNAQRGITTTIIVSQAAGVAAALCVDKRVEPRNLDVRLLQDELRNQDVVLDPPDK